MELPPGLPLRQGSSNQVQQMPKKLSKNVQDALKAVGLDFTPEPELEPLEEILRSTQRGEGRCGGPDDSAKPGLR